jgi:hypothetical protein
MNMNVQRASATLSDPNFLKGALVGAAAHSILSSNSNPTPNQNPDHTFRAELSPGVHAHIGLSIGTPGAAFVLSIFFPSLWDSFGRLLEHFHTLQLLFALLFVFNFWIFVLRALALTTKKARTFLICAAITIAAQFAYFSPESLSWTWLFIISVLAIVALGITRSKATKVTSEIICGSH